MNPELKDNVVKQLIKSAFPKLVFWYHETRKSSYYKFYGKGLTPWGFNFIGSPEMQNGSFEETEVEIALEFMRKCEIFVDIGANVGYYTCLARNIGKEVIAIEPLRENLDYLFENLSNNSWNDVEVFPMAVADKSGIAEIYGGGTGASLVKNWSGSSEIWLKRIPVTTLDIILSERNLDKSIFIKMDVEGFEHKALMGATQILSRKNKPIWLIEICYDEHHPDGVNQEYEHTFKLMWDYGYKSYTADSRRQEVNARNFDNMRINLRRTINYIFIAE
jgi:FkbM family methyltransferase